jgi:hypothetical protein
MKTETKAIIFCGIGIITALIGQQIWGLSEQQTYGMMLTVLGLNIIPYYSFLILNLKK